MEFFRAEKGGVECAAGMEGIFIKKIKENARGLAYVKKKL